MSASTSHPAPASQQRGGGSPAPDAGLLNLRQIIAIFRRRLRIFVAVVLFVCALGAAYTLTLTPIYRANATVMLNVRPETVTEVKEVTANLNENNATIQTEVELLRSRDLAQRVVIAMGLEKDPEFNPALGHPGGLAAVKRTVAGWFGHKPPKIAARTPAQLVADRPNVVDAVMQRLDVERVPDTFVINVAFESSDPEKAARIANAFADRYLLGQLEAKYGATQEASDWLSSRLSQLRSEVEAAEAAVEQYKIANNLLSSSGATLTEQEISVYNQGVASAKADLAEKEARLRTAQAQLRAGSTGEDVGEALGSNVIQSLRVQRAQISVNVAEMTRRYGPRHPEMLKAQRQLQDIDQQIQDEIKRIISNLEAEVEVSRGRTNAVQRSLSGARGTLASTNRASVRLRELERNAEAVRAVYESFLNRYKETTSQQGLERTDGRVVSQAKVPLGPHSPNIPLNMALALALGLGCGLVAIVLAEAMSSGLASGVEVENKLGLPLLASIPDLRSVAKTSLKPTSYVVAKPLSGFTESFRTLRTALAHGPNQTPAKIVAITSTLPAEGKSTTSLCLARTAALQGQNVVVVDCDLRRKGVTELTGQKIDDAGLIEVLDGRAKIADALIEDGESDAAVLPLSSAALSPKDVFDTPEMRKLLTQLSQQFDLVILDCPPVLAVADTRVLVALADVVVLVVRWRRTAANVINAAIDIIEASGGVLRGVALSRMDMRQQRLYGYGDPTYYYSEYSKYYTA